MRPFIAAILLSSLPALANAQVVVNHAALDQLAGILPVVAETPAPPPVAHHVRRVVHKTMNPPVVVAVTKPPAPLMTVPVVVKPVLPVVSVPKPPAPVAALNFASGAADLPGNAAAALKPFCAATGMISITALAPADPSDISSAMRLSMNRAFAVRDALTACGVPSSRIIPRAMGSVAGQDDDVTKVSVTP